MTIQVAPDTEFPSHLIDLARIQLVLKQYNNRGHSFLDGDQGRSRLEFY